MSEYVQKQALVKWLEHEYETCSDELTGFRAFDRVKRKIQSSAFDADTSEIQRLRAIEQAIRDFQPMKEQQAGYEALVAWLESTTPFVLKPEKEEPNHDAG